MKAGAVLFMMAGVTLAAGLVVYYGFDGIATAFLAAGWRGVLAMSAFHIVTLAPAAIAWRALQTEAMPRASLVFLWARWLRDSVGNILAFLPIAGELVSARELTRLGVRGVMAGATTVVDLTLELLSQILFTLLGVAVLLVERPDNAIAEKVVAGTAIALFVVLGFVLAQRRGLFPFLVALPEWLGLTWNWQKLRDGQTIHDAIGKIYAAHRRLLAGTTLHLVSWIVGTGEAWLALYFMGVPLGIGDVLAIESLVFALRSIGFLVPLAAGVQEGGYVLIGALFGLGPDAALALSFLKRAREIVTGAPALIVWQVVEVRRLRGRKPQMSRT